MISLFNNKPYLRDLIPPNHIDFHSHILPGIDDGAATIENTVFLVNKLIEYGCSQLITTPHVMNNVWENSTEAITENLENTKTELQNRGINIPIRAAAEYLLDDNFVNLFTNEKLRTLKDNYVLVELSYINPPIQVYQMLFDLQVAGYIPVLAHPERYSFYHNNFEEYQKLKSAGCLFQLNLLSTVGYYGKEVSQAAAKLLSSGMIDFAGSDVHHSIHIKAFEQKISKKNGALISAALQNNSLFRF